MRCRRSLRKAVLLLHRKFDHKPRRSPSPLLLLKAGRLILSSPSGFRCQRSWCVALVCGRLCPSVRGNVYPVSVTAARLFHVSLCV